MKTTSLLLLSSLVASSVFSGVTGQMLPLEGSNGDPPPPSVKGHEQSIEENLPAPPEIKDAPARPENKGPHKRPAQTDEQEAAHIHPPQHDVVHITKTRTEIVYPRPNPRLWKYLPEFPAHGPQGKIVAEFNLDDEGHFHKGRKHSGWDHHKGEFHRLSVTGEGYPHHRSGYHHNGEVYYEGGNGWTGGQGGHKHKGVYHKGDKEEGKGGDHHESGKGGDHHESGKGGDHQEEGKEEKEEKSEDTHEKGDKKKKNLRPGKGDEEIDKKKKVDGYQPKQVDGFIAAQSANGTESTGSAESAQKPGSAPVTGTPKNAAASSSSAAASHSSSSSSAKSSSSSSTSASSNTHQVAVSFVAVMAATAAWCLA